MKPRSLLIAAFLAPALFCPAQDKPPAVADSTAPAAKDTVKPTAQDAARLAMTDSYVIEASDVVDVFVWKEPDLTTKGILVRPDGMISMPLLGDVKASGKTPLQLAAEITDRLKKYVQDPNVTIMLGTNNSKMVYMIGEVAKTGPVGMTSGMTLLEAISRAGGLSEFANKKKIYILRNDGGKQQKIPVQYKQALRGDSALNLILIPGDTIVVP